MQRVKRLVNGVKSMWIMKILSFISDLCPLTFFQVPKRGSFFFVSEHSVPEHKQAFGLWFATEAQHVNSTL